jgi:hypothetical protein
VEGFIANADVQEAQFSPIRSELPEIKADPGSQSQPQSPAGDQKKELVGQERDTVIVLDLTDQQMEEALSPNSSK